MRVPVDGQGRMRADGAAEARRARRSSALQAGNVNTGAFDPIGRDLRRGARQRGAWVHVDGAFGLWAAAAPGARPSDGRRRSSADSWATDAHKWLNVPYDSGLAFVRDPAHLQRAMSVHGRLSDPGARTASPRQYTPELSRRARGIEIWAALRSLGRVGPGRPDRAHLPPRRAASPRGCAAAGCEVLNEVVLNQVLVSFGDAETTRRVIAAHPAGRHLLVRRNGLAGPRRDAHQRVLLGHHRRGRRAQPGRHAQGGAPRSAAGAGLK